LNLTFEHPDAAFWFIAAVSAGALFVFAAARRRAAMARLATENLQHRFRHAVGPTGRTGRAALLVGALTILTVALMDPRLGSRYEQVAQRNIDVIFMLDTSRSMLAEDLRPNRLERAKEYIRDVVEHAVGDRFGLVVFGGTPTLKVPLTRDLNAMTLALNEVQPRSGRRGGSLIGDAVRLAERALEADQDGLRTIIVLSDGEDMGSFPVEAAAEAADQGITIWTVGLGDPDDGARIPIDVNGTRLFLTHDGQEVWTRMNPTLMQQVAAAANGQFIPAGTADLDLRDIYDRIIAPATGRRVESARVERRTPRYRWCVAAALMLLAAEGLVGVRRRRPQPSPAAVSPRRAVPA